MLYLVTGVAVGVTAAVYAYQLKNFRHSKKH
jgi:hypothetical protein